VLNVLEPALAQLRQQETAAPLAEAPEHESSRAAEIRRAAETIFHVRRSPVVLVDLSIR
jgi:hypothetical protein